MDSNASLASLDQPKNPDMDAGERAAEEEVHLPRRSFAGPPLAPLLLNVDAVEKEVWWNTLKEEHSRPPSQGGGQKVL